MHSLSEPKGQDMGTVAQFNFVSLHVSTDTTTNSLSFYNKTVPLYKAGHSTMPVTNKHFNHVNQKRYKRIFLDQGMVLSDGENQHNRLYQM